MLHTISDLDIENVFALTGDYPKGSTPVFDMDSVELVTLMNELRQNEGLQLWIAVAVTPFKYTEPDCVYQYLKLEKKFAAGADYAITQLGFDAKKFGSLSIFDPVSPLFSAARTSSPAIGSTIPDATIAGQEFEAMVPSIP